MDEVSKRFQWTCEECGTHFAYVPPEVRGEAFTLMCPKCYAIYEIIGWEFGGTHDEGDTPRMRGVSKRGKSGCPQCGRSWGDVVPHVTKAPSGPDPKIEIKCFCGFLLVTSLGYWQK